MDRCVKSGEGGKMDNKGYIGLYTLYVQKWSFNMDDKKSNMSIYA